MSARNWMKELPIQAMQKNVCNSAVLTDRTNGALVQFIAAIWLCLLNVWNFHGKKYDEMDYISVDVQCLEEISCAYCNSITYFSTTSSVFPRDYLCMEIMWNFSKILEKFHRDDNCYASGDKQSFHSSIYPNSGVL